MHLRNALEIHTARADENVSMGNARELEILEVVAKEMWIAKES